MKQKSIVLLAILVVLIAGVFIANNLIGAKVAESVDQQLQTMLEEEGDKLPFTITYSHVSSSPISGSVTIHDYKLVDETEDFNMTGGSIELGMPVTEILALRNDKELKSVKKMSVTMVSPDVQVEGVSVFKADYFQLAYDGELSLFELENAENGILPTTRQAVAISAKGMKLDQKSLMTVVEGLNDTGAQLPFGSMMSEQFKEEADFEISVEFDPDTKLLTLDNYSTSNGFTRMNASGKLKFSGETTDDFEPESGNASMTYEMEAYEIDYPEVGKMKFEGGEADMELDFKMSDENSLFPGVPDFNITMDMSMDGMEMELGDEMMPLIAQSGLQLDKPAIKVNGIDISFSKKEDDINIKAFDIDIEDLIKLKANARLENGTTTDYFGNEQQEPVFKSSKIEISGLSDGMMELIETMEASMPKPFPRKGSKIVIEFSGSISDPKIKGVTD